MSNLASWSFQHCMFSPPLSWFRCSLHWALGAKSLARSAADPGSIRCPSSTPAISLLPSLTTPLPSALQPAFTRHEKETPQIWQAERLPLTRIALQVLRKKAGRTQRRGNPPCGFAANLEDCLSIVFTAVVYSRYVWGKLCELDSQGENIFPCCILYFLVN